MVGFKIRRACKCGVSRFQYSWNVRFSFIYKYSEWLVGTQNILLVVYSQLSAINYPHRSQKTVGYVINNNSFLDRRVLLGSWRSIGRPHSHLRNYEGVGGGLSCTSGWDLCSCLVFAQFCSLLHTLKKNHYIFLYITLICWGNVQENHCWLSFPFLQKEVLQVLSFLK